MNPATVRSPKARWSLIDVLYDGGDDGHALAIGTWDDERVLAARWNGAAAEDLGNPQSRGLPTWFILPTEYREAILGLPFIPSAKVALARALLGSTAALSEYEETESDDDEESSSIVCRSGGCYGQIHWGGGQLTQEEAGDSTPPPYDVGECDHCSTPHLRCGECGEVMSDAFGAGAGASYETVLLKCETEDCPARWDVTYEKGDPISIRLRPPKKPKN